jgi:hypothetical protein
MVPGPQAFAAAISPATPITAMALVAATSAFAFTAAKAPTMAVADRK